MSTSWKFKRKTRLYADASVYRDQVFYLFLAEREMTQRESEDVLSNSYGRDKTFVLHLHYTATGTVALRFRGKRPVSEGECVLALWSDTCVMCITCERLAMLWRLRKTPGARLCDCH